MADSRDAAEGGVDALRAQLERSRDDVAAGRTASPRSILTAMHGRAMRRIAKKRSTARDQAIDLG